MSAYLRAVYTKIFIVNTKMRKKYLKCSTDYDKI